MPTRAALRYDPYICSSPCPDGASSNKAVPRSDDVRCGATRYAFSPARCQAPDQSCAQREWQPRSCAVSSNILGVPDIADVFAPPRHQFVNRGVSKGGQKTIEPGYWSTNQSRFQPKPFLSMRKPSSPHPHLSADEDSASRTIASTTPTRGAGSNNDNNCSTVSVGNSNDTASDSCLNSKDIICGRGSRTMCHPGNVAYKALIKKHEMQYLFARRGDKPVIAMKILDTVRSNGGRFVKRDNETGEWHDIGDHKSYEKVCQSLRDMAPHLRRQMMSKSFDRGNCFRGRPNRTSLSRGYGSGAPVQNRNEVTDEESGCDSDKENCPTAVACV